MERFVITLASLLVFAAIGTGAPISCPVVEHLHPCKCKRMAFGLQVICEKVNDVSQLVKSFKVLRDHKVQKLILSSLEPTEVLPVDIFDDLEISELRVEKSQLRFSEPAFSGLDESLHVLNVAQHSMIKSSENFSLARLHKLTDLNIKSNPMKIVRDKWLNGKIPNVLTIRLDENEIDAIESRAFADLLNLTSISIAENRIQTVERSMFPRPAKALTKIDLSGNEIKSLPYDFFFEMPKLEEVTLSGNDIQTLPEMTWKSVWEQLQSVLLFENSLVCDDKLNWLKKLRWPKQVVAFCTFPDSLKDKTLQDVYKT